MLIIDLKEMGAKCKEFRISAGMLQIDVANETGYSLENISAFENGRNDNSRILLWYLAYGMNVNELIGG